MCGKQQLDNFFFFVLKMPQGTMKSKAPSKSQIKKKSAAERKPRQTTKKGPKMHDPKNLLEDGS